jgi:hypothetical protein
VGNFIKFGWTFLQNFRELVWNVVFSNFTRCKTSYVKNFISTRICKVLWQAGEEGLVRRQVRRRLWRGQRLQVFVRLLLGRRRHLNTALKNKTELAKPDLCKLPGTDVMIFEIFSPKQFGEKFGVFE